MINYEELQKYLKDNQNTWLVTGAAGFIGSNLVEKLLTLNQKVIGLDSFDTGYQHNIDEAISDANQIAGEDLSYNFKYYSKNFIIYLMVNIKNIYKIIKNNTFTYKK